MFVGLFTSRLVGDVLLATGFLSYLGPFNQNFRNLLLSRWEKEMTKNKIPFSENLNLINMLTDAATVCGEIVFWVCTNRVQTIWYIEFQKFVFQQYGSALGLVHLAPILV